MEIKDINDKLLALLTAIAPDVDSASVDPNLEFRDQFDFDSMDALHFATAVSDEFKIEIAETDYPNLANLRGAGQFVQSKLTEIR